MPRRISPLAMALAAALSLLSTIHAQDFKKQVIYQLITDRFFAGTPNDNDPPQSPGLYDGTQTNWHLYWGGNFAGIQAKLAYLKGMGITAIWISPPIDNINVNITVTPHATSSRPKNTSATPPTAGPNLTLLPPQPTRMASRSSSISPATTPALPAPVKMAHSITKASS